MELQGIDDLGVLLSRQCLIMLVTDVRFCHNSDGILPEEQAMFARTKKGDHRTLNVRSVGPEVYLARMFARIREGDHRTLEQIRQHYEIEKELASRLRNSSRQERSHLYSSLYDELYQRVPLHPQLTQKSSPENTTKKASSQARFLRHFLRRDSVFLEIGPGDCALSFEVAKFVQRVYAIDVSEEITKSSTLPHNFQLILSDGCSVPLPANSVNVAYSNQLMEHLHPDDALGQLQSIYKALVPGGIYFCITPNRLNGPHDISKFFDRVATGFHLKEYTTIELCTLFRETGFSKVRAYIGAKGIYMRFPLFIIRSCESLLGVLPHALGKAIAYTLPFRLLLGIRLLGIR